MTMSNWDKTHRVHCNEQTALDHPYFNCMCTCHPVLFRTLLTFFVFLLLFQLLLNLENDNTFILTCQEQHSIVEIQCLHPFY